MRNILICLVLMLVLVELFAPHATLSVVALNRVETDVNGDSFSSDNLFGEDNDDEDEDDDDDEEVEEELEEVDESEYLQEEEDFSATKGFLVDFYNDFKDEVVSLYWKNPSTSEEVWLADIEPMSRSSINTFPGHVFVGVADLSEVSPSSHKIAKGELNYRFGKVSRSQQQPPRKTSTTASTTTSSNSKSDAVVSGGNKARKGYTNFIKYIDVKSTSVSAKFRCMCKEIDLWYDKVTDENYQGSLSLGQEMTINTYEGHVFLFTPKGNKNKVLARYVMSDDSPVYEIKDPDFKIPKELYDHTEKEKKFKEEYFKKNGIKWRHYYGPDGPRGPPVLHMWPAQYEGQTHEVRSTNGYWNCDGKASSCKSTEPVDLTLEVMSLAPKAYLIENFISHAEADEIVRVAKTQIGESLVGNSDAGGARKSSTRTSRNAWVKRGSSDIIKTIYLRAADLLNVSESILDNAKNAEDMQVVFYKNGQKYDSHHDWGVSGYPESRYITLLMYLTDQVDNNAGGETAFPKGANGRGFKIHPGKGSAVLFYNILEDGNADDLALHAALPVHRGEKWLANFWIWDPKRK